jgi:diguanylate cyclase (GGDEF)-like protein
MVVGIVQGMPRNSMIVTFLNLVFWFGLYIASRIFPDRQEMLRTVLVVGFNFFFIPVLFFTSGGIKSGMLFFFTIGILLDAVLLRGNKGGIVFVLSMIVFEACILISHYYPSLLPEVTPMQHYQDVLTTLLPIGICVYCLAMLIFTAYNRERNNNLELMKKLQELSSKDALSGLYNRRELFRRLNVMYMDEPEVKRERLTRENRYIAMFDVDNFKKINDTKGHGFGDIVLSRIAQTIQGMISASDGELAARYGGEEFVCIISADNREQAFQRVNSIRKSISSLEWEEYPDFTVTISGGLVSCEDEPDINKALHDVDDLLYKAKAEGKNRIIA